MVQIKRKRYIIVTGDEKKIFCGLARNYELKEIENLGDTPIKTYMSEKKAKSGFLSSWWNSEKEDFENGKYKVVPIYESIEKILNEKMD